MKKSVTLCLCAVLIAAVLCGCENTSTYADRKYTEAMKTQIEDMIGKPDVSNFFEYSQLKEIYEMRDNPNLLCYWYIKNDMTGKWIYQGTCIGYGIPYGASITSPDQYAYNNSGAVISMAEPNGLYTNSLSTSATWVLTTDGNGNITPTYVESEITVTQSKIDANLCEVWSIPNDY